MFSRSLQRHQALSSLRSAPICTLNDALSNGTSSVAQRAGCQPSVARNSIFYNAAAGSSTASAAAAAAESVAPSSASPLADGHSPLASIQQRSMSRMRLQPAEQIEEQVAPSVFSQQHFSIPSELEDSQAEQQERRRQQEGTEKELIDILFSQSIEEMSTKYIENPLVEQQKALETRFTEGSVVRYRKGVTGATDRGQGASLPSVVNILMEWCKPLSDALAAARANATLNTPSTMDREIKNFAELLSLVDSDRMSWIVMHTLVGHCLQNPHRVLFSRVCTDVANGVIGEYNHAKLWKIPKAKYLMEQSEAQSSGRRLLSDVNRMASQFALQPEGSELYRAPTEICVQFGAYLINKFIEIAKIPVVVNQVPGAVTLAANASNSGAIEMVNAFTHEQESIHDALEASGGQSRHRAGVLRVHEAFLQLVEEGHEKREYTQELKHLPMIVEPRPWTAYNNGAYLTQNAQMMRTKGSALQSQVLRDADMTEVFEALNVLSQQQWHVNKNVLNVIRQVWDELGGGMGAIPAKENDALPEKPETDDADALRKYLKQSAKIRQHNRDLHSLRCDLRLKLSVAEEFAENVLYFPHNIDFRGRAYPIPPHLNHMGADLSRSLLVFATGQPIGERGIFWLKIHLANLCGKDKFSFEERITFIDANMDKIMDSADQPLEGNRWWLDSENPWQCLAACFELTACMRSPNPQEFISHIPVQMDGSCNGLQHYAALGRDNLGALHVNLLPTDKPMDVYNGVLNVVLKNIESDARSNGDPRAQLLRGKVQRSTIKQTVMTSVYGVTFVGAREQIARRLKEKKEIEEDMVYPCSIYLAKQTLKSLGEVFRSAREIMDWLNELAHLVSTENEPVLWITPLGLPVVQPYFSTRSKQVKTVLQTVTLVDKKDQLPVSRERQKSAFPPNFVHSLDASHMFLTARACKAEGIDFAAVHDSYWCHANRVDRMNRIIREQFLYLHSQPLLETLLDNMKRAYPHVNFPPVPKKGSLDLKRVLDAPYFFD